MDKLENKLRSIVTKIKTAIREGDYEEAHSLEDQLMIKTLKAIKKGCNDPKEVAAIALMTQSLDFPRWTA